MPVRAPSQTRQRILDAALAEFVAHGLRGARVDAIARRAGVNVRLLYYYFRDKDDLYRAILSARFAERPVYPDPQAGMDRQLPDMFSFLAANADWVRLSQWEALELGESGAVVDEPERQGQWMETLEQLRTEQAKGAIDPDLDPEMLLIALFALTSYPTAFGPATRLITGTAVSSPAFQERYRAFLAELGRRLAPGPRSGVEPPGDHR